MTSKNDTLALRDAVRPATKPTLNLARAVEELQRTGRRVTLCATPKRRLRDSLV